MNFYPTQGPSTHDLLVAAYREWQRVARDALRHFQGTRLNVLTNNLLKRLDEDLEQGRDPLPRLRSIHPRLKLELERPESYESSFRLGSGVRQELASLEAEIKRLEARLEEEEEV